MRRKRQEYIVCKGCLISQLKTKMHTKTHCSAECVEKFPTVNQCIFGCKFVPMQITNSAGKEVWQDRCEKCRAGTYGTRLNTKPSNIQKRKKRNQTSEYYD